MVSDLHFVQRKSGPILDGAREHASELVVRHALDLAIARSRRAIARSRRAIARSRGGDRADERICCYIEAKCLGGRDI